MEHGSLDRHSRFCDERSGASAPWLSKSRRCRQTCVSSEALRARRSIWARLPRGISRGRDGHLGSHLSGRPAAGDAITPSGAANAVASGPFTRVLGITGTLVYRTPGNLRLFREDFPNSCAQIINRTLGTGRSAFDDGPVDVGPGGRRVFEQIESAGALRRWIHEPYLPFQSLDLALRTEDPGVF